LCDSKTGRILYKMANTEITKSEIGTWNIDRADGTRLIERMEGAHAEAIELAEMYCRLYRLAVVVEAG